MPIIKDNIFNGNENIFDCENLNQIYSDSPSELQKNLSWCKIDLTDDKECENVIDFLNNNYQSKESRISQKKKKKFLRWLLLIPNYTNKLHIGIKYKDKFVGTIFGSIFDINIYQKKTKATEINLLCINKKLRNLNLASILINESARVTFKDFNIRIGLYTAKKDLPNKLSTFNYYHRKLNLKKLLKYDLIAKPEIKMNSFEKIFKPKKINIKGNYRLLELKDCESCCDKLNKKLVELNLAYNFTLERFIHFFLPKDDIVKTIVVENNDEITDMISFYYQESLVIEENVKIKNGNLFYYFNNGNSLSDLVNIILNVASNDYVDRIKVLGEMGYNNLDERLKFVKGYTDINLYLFNWKCQKIKSKDVAYFVI